MSDFIMQINYNIIGANQVMKTFSEYDYIYMINILS